MRTNIIEEVKNAEFYSVLADEVSSHNIEHLPICLRFVDGSFETREDFIGYVKLKRVRAQDIAIAIKGMLLEVGFSLNEFQGQGDLVSNKKSEKFRAKLYTLIVLVIHLILQL